MTQLRLLVVDDDDDVRESLVDELSPNFAVEAVACGREALAALDRTRFDVVISDQRMPDLTGLEVLEAVRLRQPDAVRILLTGFLDDDAHASVLEADAPYKLSKPWHDSVEITVRRALEQRDRTRRLAKAFDGAVAAAVLEAELAAAVTPSEIARTLVTRIAAAGVERVSVVVGAGETARTLAAYHHPDAGTSHPTGETWARWTVDEPLDTAAGDRAAGVANLPAGPSSATPAAGLRLRVEGRGPAHALVLAIAARARSWLADDPAGRLARASVDPVARERLASLSRQAVIGQMADAFVHELASVVQGIRSEALGLSSVLRERPQNDAVTAHLEGIEQLSEIVVRLFRALRSFLHGGGAEGRGNLRDAVTIAQRITAGQFKHHVTLRVGELPDVELAADGALFAQVLVNVLRNAAEASPRGGVVELDATLAQTRVVLTITDDGPGVAPELVDRLFLPFATSKPGATGLGLAISAEILGRVGGSIAYEPSRGRSTFVLVAPLANSSVPPLSRP